MAERDRDLVRAVAQMEENDKQAIAEVRRRRAEQAALVIRAAVARARIIRHRQLHQQRKDQDR